MLSQAHLNEIFSVSKLLLYVRLENINIQLIFDASTNNRYLALLIICQGGPGTINTTLEASKVHTPIVLIDGSGQAADALTYAWRYLQSTK